MNFLQSKLKSLGFSAVGRACGVSRQAVASWYGKGSLPDSEHYPPSISRATNYADIIAGMAKCSREDLL